MLLLGTISTSWKSDAMTIQPPTHEMDRPYLITCNVLAKTQISYFEINMTVLVFWEVLLALQLIRIPRQLF